MNYIIETDHLTKRYGATAVVDQVNFHVPKGKVYGLLGRNGAGKTTAMKMMLQLVFPTDGSILLFGKDCRDNAAAIYKNIGSIIETPGFYGNLTGEENLEIMARLRGQFCKNAVPNALEIVGLNQEKRKIFSNYSLGMKQRLGIAAAIMHKPKLLILDEPINGLDPIGICEIRTFLSKLSRDNGTTIFISSHVLSEIEQIADIIGVMHQGRLIEEVDMAELRNRSRTYTEFDLSDGQMAAIIIKSSYPGTDYTIQNNTLKVYGPSPVIGEMNRNFALNGLLVTRINPREENLEEYFSKLIGGGGIA
ncbi:MAG: bacitracin transporter ATP-binding protein [Lacrimispora sp.]|nr:bacitracin transporter ATP-binding protein [Lacrimispora sp.]